MRSGDLAMMMARAYSRTPVAEQPPPPPPRPLPPPPHPQTTQHCSSATLKFRVTLPVNSLTGTCHLPK